MFKSLVSRFEPDILAGIDISSTEKNNPTTNNYHKETSQLRSVYQITGFSVNLSFTDIATIVESIYSTDVHHNSDPLVEFAIGVSCYGYPGKFISVWIYIANLTRP